MSTPFFFKDLEHLLPQSSPTARSTSKDFEFVSSNKPITMPQAAHFVPPPACAAAHKDTNSKNKKRALILIVRLSRYSSRSSFQIYVVPTTMLTGARLMERNAVSSSNKKIMNEMKNEVGLRRRKRRRAATTTTATTTNYKLNF